MNKPYIGITGITEPREIDGVLDTLHTEGFKPGASHVGMVGFLASEETVAEERPRSARYVANAGALAALVRRVGDTAMPAVHYKIVDRHNFAAPLIELFRHLYDARLCRAVQLNGTPSPLEMWKFFDEYPQARCIYQVGPDLLARGPKAVAQEVSRHRGVFRDVLIDPSCGCGIEMDLEQAVAAAQAVKEAQPDVTIGFAGGFGGEDALWRIADIVTAFGDGGFSVDAEGKLRNTVTDRVDLCRVQAYLHDVYRGLVLGRLRLMSALLSP